MHTYILHTYIRTYIHTKFQTGGDVPSVFKRFCNLSEVVENAAKKHNTKIMWNEKLGFLGTCPSNIGTGLRASVMAELPNFRALKGYGIRFIYYSMCVCKSVSLALYVCVHVCMHIKSFCATQITRAFNHLFGVRTATQGTGATRRKERSSS